MQKQIGLLALLGALCFPSYAADGLDTFLSNVNIQARGNIDGFAIKLSAQFGVSENQVKIVLGKVSQPADAFMIFQLGQMTRQPVDSVLRSYHSNKGRGWGALAKDLGIKPGSAEFHALKRGELQFGNKGEAQESHGQGKGRGRNKH